MAANLTREGPTIGPLISVEGPGVIDPVTPHIVDAHATSARVADETSDVRQCSPPAQAVAVMMKNAPPPGDPGPNRSLPTSTAKCTAHFRGKCTFADFAPGTDAAKGSYRKFQPIRRHRKTCRGKRPVLIDSCR